MEVVLPNGELMRTGMAAVPGAKSWADNKYGYGAHVDGLFAQSNFGIVTKMGFWMMPEPEHFLSCRVSVPGYRDIVPLIDVVNYLEDQGLIGFPRYASSLDPIRHRRRLGRMPPTTPREAAGARSPTSTTTVGRTSLWRQQAGVDPNPGPALARSEGNGPGPRGRPLGRIPAQAGIALRRGKAIPACAGMTRFGATAAGVRRRFDSARCAGGNGG
ncbi:hypothetical protein [Rhodanobacter lindaniclasticus]